MEMDRVIGEQMGGIKRNGVALTGTGKPGSFMSLMGALAETSGFLSLM